MCWKNGIARDQKEYIAPIILKTIFFRSRKYRGIGNPTITLQIAGNAIGTAISLEHRQESVSIPMMPAFSELFEETRSIVFVWWRDDPCGFFVQERLNRFLLGFYSAKESSRTFGEFWNSFEPSEQSYLKDFMDCDPAVPRPEDLLSESDLWILGSGEMFPLYQCASDPLGLPDLNLSSKYLAELKWSHTDVGIEVPQFRKDLFVEMCADLNDAGFTVGCRPIIDDAGNLM